jgi:hypothetical protein
MYVLTLTDWRPEVVLCSKKNSAAKADAVTLGDAWLAPAIQAGLIQPIPAALESRWWVSVPFLLPLPVSLSEKSFCSFHHNGIHGTCAETVQCWLHEMCVFS